MEQTLEEKMEQVKKELVQNQLYSLYISIKNLAKSLDRDPVDDIDSCVIENIDRYDESQLRQRCEDIQALTRSLSKGGKDDLHGNCHDRQRALLYVAEHMMPIEWCFLPYDASDLFIKQGRMLRAYFVEELKHHCHVGLPLLLGPIIAQQDKWVKGQLADYEQYLRRPVHDDVVLVTVQEYKESRACESPFQQGWILHALSRSVNEERWWVREVEASPGTCPCQITIEAITITRAKLRAEFDGAAYLKKDVPATHPSLGNLDLDFDKEFPPEHGIVVVWRFAGSEAWMDRYGHLVPQHLL